MKQNKKLLLLLLILVFITSGCTASIYADKKPMTDKQQGVMWMSIYISEYDSVKETLESPSVTQSQISLALKKKEILTKAYPLIKDFTSPTNPINPKTGKKWTNSELLKYNGPIIGYSMSQEKVKILNNLIDELAALSGGV